MILLISAQRDAREKRSDMRVYARYRVRGVMRYMARVMMFMMALLSDDAVICCYFMLL